MILFCVTYQNTKYFKLNFRIIVTKETMHNMYDIQIIKSVESS